jgi:hypothetical protein
MTGSTSPRPFLVGVVGLGGTHGLSIVTHALNIIDPLKNILHTIGGGYILETGTDDFLGPLPKNIIG